MNARAVAYSAVRAAIRAKAIKPARLLRCVDCDRRALDYDHRDYAQPLVVEPVCRSCNLLRGAAVNADRGDHQSTHFGRWLSQQDRGAGVALAARLNLPRPLLTQWAKGIRQIPMERCPGIERETGGAVTCEEMRPDTKWVRVKDRKWPHPGGRPLVDLCAPAIPEPAKAA